MKIRLKYDAHRNKQKAILYIYIHIQREKIRDRLKNIICNLHRGTDTQTTHTNTRTNIY